MKTEHLFIRFIFYFTSCILFINTIHAQTGINESDPDNSALLEMTSDERGLLIPRMTTADRDNNIDLTGEPESLLIYNTTEKCLQIYVNSQWNSIWCSNCAPVITSDPSDQTISAGGNTSFTVTATGTSISYQWQENDGVSGWLDISDSGSNPQYSGATTTTLSLTNVPITYDTYQYRCVVSGACSPDATSNAAILTVN